jgi:hypothetical protein
MIARRVFLGVACACAAAPLAFAQPPSPSPEGGKFVCPPCGCSQDGKEFDQPGTCPDPECKMQLIPKPTPQPAKPPS